MSVSDFIKDKYVLCLCEGNAELDIMDMLLENEMLIISKNDLIERKFHKRESVRAIEEKHLGLHYEKEVVILRVIDSKSEKFKLSRLYRNRFSELAVITAPEIEILIILDKGDHEDFLKSKKRGMKASAYCKDRYKFKNLKKVGFMKEYFSDTQRLIKAICLHKSFYKADNYTISDLLKSINHTFSVF